MSALDVIAEPVRFHLSLKRSVGVVYKGPLDEVSCECGAVFRRGEKVIVSALVAGCLRSGPAAEQFAFLA